jgi:hypothetical protein
MEIEVVTGSEIFSDNHNISLDVIVGVIHLSLTVGLSKSSILHFSIFCENIFICIKGEDKREIHK